MDSLTKPPFQVTSAEVVIICPDAYHMGVSKNSGTPKWMVKIRKNPIKIDDLGGFPTPIFGSTPICEYEPFWCKAPHTLLRFHLLFLQPECLHDFTKGSKFPDGKNLYYCC